MKVLWYVNIVMPAASNALGMKAPMGGGWLVGQAESLSIRGADLTIVNAAPQVKERTEVTIGNIRYILFPSKLEECEEQFTQILMQTGPDIVHIFGTEYQYNTEICRICRAVGQKYVVSVQGLMSECAKHYMDGLPSKFNKTPVWIRLMERAYYADGIALKKQGFEEQGCRETQALQLSKNVIGRTVWDKQCVAHIAPGCRYFHVDENLRPEFYTDEIWSYDNCKRHSIFISQAFYPIKGFHQFLKALPALIKRYPDVHVFVGGQKAYTLNNAFCDMIVNAFFEYQHYIKQLIGRYRLESYITYLGPLNAQQMKYQFLRSNVFVSASTIENSPNSVGEAMILGTPVVASDVGGTSTLLRNGHEGLLYPFADTEALQQAVIRVFDAPDEASAMGKAARQHARFTHDADKNTSALLKAYETITTE